MINGNIIKWFKLLIKQLEFHVDNKTGKDKLVYSYKLSSIEKALKVIENIKFTIKSGSELKSYKGIGEGTIRRIDEILKTGSLSEVNDADISGKYLEYIDELVEVFGIGRSKAYELYTKYNIKSIKDLKKAHKEGIIELPQMIVKGLKYVDQIKTKIPRKEMDMINIYLVSKGIKFDSNMNIIMCGSYRREKDHSNDIDIIISHPDLMFREQVEKSDLMQRFIKELIKDKFIIDSLTSENAMTKYMGLCKYNKHIRRIDIRFIAQESYYTAILYFTGSGEFNQQMRRVAKSMGYTLNEYNISKDNKSIRVNSEKEIFNILNMEYVKPVDRNM